MTEENIWTYEQISRPHLKLLRLLAVLPFEGKTFDSIGTKLLGIYWHINIFIYNSMFFGYGVRMISRKSFEIDYISEQLVVENVCIRYILLFIKRKKFSKLMEMCKELWSFLTPEESRIIRIYERKAYYFWNIIMINAFLIVSSFIIIAQFVRLTPNVTNGTNLKILPFRFYVDVQEEPFFTIVSVFQGIITVNISIVDSGIEAAGLYLILISCGYLKSVQNRLISLTKFQERIKKKDKEFIKTANTCYNNVRTCVRFHQNIMVLCEELEKFMREIYLVGIFTTVYNISMLGLNLLQKKNESIKYMALLTFNVFQLFSYQWSSEYLLIESGNIAYASYFVSLKQFGQHKGTNKILHFLILRAQKPIQLTAGGYLKLSMELFAKMIKSSFSLFTLLYKFKD